MSRATCNHVLQRRPIVAEYVRQGLDNQQIATQLGVSERTVIRDKRALGLAAPVIPPLPPEKWVEAKQLLDEGAPYSEVARTIGRSWQRVQHRFPGMGWTRQDAGRYARLVVRYKELAS